MGLFPPLSLSASDDVVALLVLDAYLVREENACPVVLERTPHLIVRDDLLAYMIGGLGVSVEVLLQDSEEIVLEAFQVDCCVLPVFHDLRSVLHVEAVMREVVDEMDDPPP